jgi:ribosome biogenesis GTPase
MTDVAISAPYRTPRALRTLVVVVNQSMPGDALDALGWDDAFAKTAGANDAIGKPGRVARVDRGVATVLVPESIRAVIDPSQREQDADSSTNVATGDWVLVDETGDAPVITAVLPRRSVFTRGDPREGIARRAQVVAANVDTVFVVHAISNGPNLRRLERELVLVYQSGAAPIVVLTKSDLADSPQQLHDAVADVARIAPDVTTLVTSAMTGDGVDALHRYAANGRTVALIGASGVGKSTLVNRLVADEVQATAAVRVRDQRGRHTTTARELIALPDGGVLIDTPGLRAVSLWEADEGLERAFPEIEALSRDCRFADCSHGNEPGCAVQAAVARGEIDPERLASYTRLNAELDRQVEIADERARQRTRGRPRR